MFFEPESEHSAASVCEGFAVAGGRVTNFTSGQGLVLMKEVLYTISGKRLPVVMNIGARALTSQGLNVHAGHDDMMSVADCGWGMIFGRNAQEAGDFCLIARRAAEATAHAVLQRPGRLPHHPHRRARAPARARVHEGRSSADPRQSCVNLMDPASPLMSGVVQNQDSYMKGKIAQRWYYDRMEPALDDAFDEFHRQTGRRYGFLEPYRCEDAEYVIVGMGCYMETVKATVDYLRDVKGIAAGCLTVFVFRPFPAARLVEALKDCQAVTVFERMDDPLSTTGNHLTRELKAAFCDAVTGQNGHDRIDRVPEDLQRVGRPGQSRRAARRHHRRVREHDPRRARILLHRHRPSPWRCSRPRIPTSGPAAASRCGAIRWAGSARSPPTRSSPPSPATSSARTCRPIPSTARRRRACPPPTT